MKRNLCFIDIETTGAVFGYHEIIEIGAVLTDPSGSSVLGRRGGRLKPLHPERITPVAQQINEYSDAGWASARPSDRGFWGGLAEFWRDCTPVCHNPSFERAFITLAAFGAGVEELGLAFHWIGTESLGWPLYERGLLPKFSLSGLSAYFGLDSEPYPHTAMAGADACREVYVKLMAAHSLCGGVPDV